MKPTFFATPAKFRAWLDRNHTAKTELLVGFYKRDSGRSSITWPESVDQALCFGWIDGVRKRVDDASYTIRFTPRKPRSIWSAINIKRVAELERLGLMRPAGMAAFAKRSDNKTAIYSYERRKTAEFDPPDLRAFRRDSQAWQFFESQAPWYRRAATHWVISAKTEETRAKRLAILIEDSGAGRTIAPLTRR